MQCMEIWGGNDSFDSHVVMAGLDAWVHSRPHGDSSAGGDVYYVSSCATGRIARLLVADVTGHGSLAEVAARQLRQLMRKFVNYIDQTRFVRSMNEQFSEISRNGGFATAVVTTFFAPTSRLSVCNAGHPPPLHFRAASGRWRFLEGGGQELSSQAARSTAWVEEVPANLPLGIIDLASYDQFGVTLDVGDLVVCYTDSLVESCDADGCTMLGQQGLLDLVAGMEVGEVATFIARLTDRIRALFDRNLRTDDVTVMMFSPNGQATAAPLGQRLLAPLRIARGVVRSVLHRGEPASLPEVSVANVGGALIPALSRIPRRGERKASDRRGAAGDPHAGV